MTPEQIEEYCLAKPDAYRDLPFGEVPVCYKVAKKIFAQLYPDKITLKCTAFSGEAFRRAYPGVVDPKGIAFPRERLKNSCRFRRSILITEIIM